MVMRWREKLKNAKGTSRLTVILAVLVLALALAVIIPSVRAYNRQGEAVACATALDTARRQLAAEYMLEGFEELSSEEAKDHITYVMNGWDDLCPGGGTVFLVRKEEPQGFDLFCGLHGPDGEQKTRLNAGYVLDQLRKALEKSRRDGEPYPETLTVNLNGKPLVCYLIDEETRFRTGTKMTEGVTGTVAYYGIVGHSDFGEGEDQEEGKIFYFSYADENHCAAWRVREGWTGDRLESRK